VRSSQNHDPKKGKNGILKLMGIKGRKVVLNGKEFFPIYLGKLVMKGKNKILNNSNIQDYQIGQYYNFIEN
jgi:hypothetical protein